MKNKAGTNTLNFTGGTTSGNLASQQLMISGTNNLSINYTVQTNHRVPNTDIAVESVVTSTTP